ncbi:MAG: diaminopimelate epimerase [Prevotella sp.]|nr:diaminopimelate epimerase [Prevotella sp.]
MGRKIHFTKMEGCGNDYVYVDTMLCPISDPSSLAVVVSRRHTGIGGDGLVLIGKPTMAGADFSMRIFNADGSEAMMCGNASRCVGKYLYEKRLTTQKLIRLQTLSGIRALRISVDPVSDVVTAVTVDMGQPSFASPSLFVPSLMERDQAGVFVSMGNPHFVVFVDSADTFDVATMGSRLEKHPAFPERCNIEFAEVRRDGIRMRVWERGSGITMACGTGACATLVAAVKTLLASRRNTVVMDGGCLDIEWSETTDHVYMTGPAAFVFEGDIEINDKL